MQRVLDVLLLDLILFGCVRREACVLRSLEFCLDRSVGGSLLVFEARFQLVLVLRVSVLYGILPRPTP
jgi:hypothetical protein